MDNELKEKYVAVAKAKFLRIPPRKARLVADMIRGKTVREALNILAVTPKPSAIPAIRRLLKSAAANVDRHEHPDPEGLFVERILVDGGPTMKRIQPRAMGRAFRIRKRTCHLTVALGE